MNILIPTDFSENALKALDYVYTRFKLDKVNIKIAHVIKTPHKGGGMLLRLDDLMKQDAENDMNNLLNEIDKKYGHQPETIIRQGDLKSWMDDYSATTPLDLVVMGTKGENNVPSKLMGSVTESFIRIANVPVLAIPADFPNRNVHHVVVASGDGNLQQQEFIKRLLDSMNLENLHFDVLTVLSSENQGSLPKSVPFERYQIGVKVVVSDSVVEGINEYLDHNSVDIIAVYHQRNSRLDYLFNRSVTKTICANTKVPVLAIPDHD
jgi:nucleotide-binding universal stress UspA family protein